MTIVRQTKELSFSKTSGIPADNISVDISTIKRIFIRTILIFSPTLFLRRDAAHFGYRNCSTFVWPRGTFGKDKQISCNAPAQNKLVACRRASVFAHLAPLSQRRMPQACGNEFILIQLLFQSIYRKSLFSITSTIL